jgi:hypothetical protein
MHAVLSRAPRVAACSDRQPAGYATGHSTGAPRRWARARAERRRALVDSLDTLNGTALGSAVKLARARAQSGGVFLDGCPLPAVQHEFLHKQVSIVSQEPILFAESILYNIAFGARAPPHSTRRQAAVRAAAASARRAGVGTGRRAPGGGARWALAAEPGERCAGASCVQAQQSARRCSVDGLGGCCADGAARRADRRARRPQVSKPHSIPLARVEEAAKLANAHDFIQSFPQGYHTQVPRARALLRARPPAALSRALPRGVHAVLAHDAT